MKKLIVLLLGVIFLSGCESESSTKIGRYNYEFKTTVIDSCEYLYANEGSNGFVLTHKGNCKFCKARK